MIVRIRNRVLSPERADESKTSPRRQTAAAALQPALHRRPELVEPEGVLALQRFVGNAAATRILRSATRSPRGALQRYKIISRGASGEERVRFEKDEPLPDAEGRLDHDGYSYKKVTDSEYLRGPIPRSEDPYGHLDHPAYDAISAILSNDPLLPAAAFQAQAYEVRVTKPAEEEGGEDVEVDVTREERKRLIDRLIELYYQPSVRFTTLKDLRPRAAIPDAWKEYFTAEERTKAVTTEIYLAAFKHMSDSKNKAESPFVSVSTNEGALISSTDYDVGSIVFGTPDAGKQAPYIVELLIPRSMLVTPDQIEATVSEQQGDAFKPLLLQQREKEVAVLTDDLTKYVARTRPNQYSRDERKGFIGEI